MMTPADLEALEQFVREAEDSIRAPAISASHWHLSILSGRPVSSAAYPQAHLLGVAGPASNCRTVGPGDGPITRGNSPGTAQPRREQTSVTAGETATICPWCAMERAMQRQGPAPRANRPMRVESCGRHSSPGDTSHPAPQAGGALDRAAGLPSNPNAGCAAAFPKGRWNS